MLAIDIVVEGIILSYKAVWLFQKFQVSASF